MGSREQRIEKIREEKEQRRKALQQARRQQRREQQNRRRAHQIRVRNPLPRKQHTPGAYCGKMVVKLPHPVALSVFPPHMATSITITSVNPPTREEIQDCIQKFLQQHSQ